MAAPHRYPHAKFVGSPHCDARPEDEPISLLVIHAISLPPEEFGGPHVQDFFQGKLDRNAHPYFEEIAHLRVSAHFFIRRNGEIIQFVEGDQRAWHAGVSSFQGRERCNDFSIGIELEGSDRQAFEAVQYEQLAALTAWLLSRYPDIDLSRIVGHEHIAPGRKTDPGPMFDWPRFRAALQHARLPAKA